MLPSDLRCVCGRKLHTQHDRTTGVCWPCERFWRSDPVIKRAVELFGGTPRPFVPLVLRDPGDRPRTDLAGGVWSTPHPPNPAGHSPLKP